MKKNYSTLSRVFRKFGIAIVALFMTAQVNAQPINESFINIANLWTGGWAQQNLSTTIGTIPTWIQGVPTNFPAFSTPDSSYIAGHFNNTTGTSTISNWLFVPNRTFNNGDIITFYTRGTGSTYADRLQVRLSQNGPSVNAGATPTSVGDFTTLLLDINPTLVAANYPATWTQYSITITGLAAPTSGRLAFRYFVTNGGPTGANSDFIGIDNFVYTPAGGGTADAAIVANVGQYTIVPLTQATPIGTTGLISNVGTLTMTNATMTVNVYDGAMANVYTASSTPIPSIAMGGNAPATVPGYTPLLADVYTVEQIVSITQPDVDNMNDTSYYQIVISDSTYARDNGVVSGTLGIGPNTPGTLGQQFAINVADDITSVSFFIANGAGTMTNQPVVMSVYNMVAGTPNAVIAQTTSLTILDAVDSMYTMPIATGPFNLVPGNYMVAVEEGDSNTVIGTTTALFTPLATWVTFPGAPILPWAHNEDYGFNVTYVIRPNLGGPVVCLQSTATVNAAACASYTAPSGAIYTTTGMYMDTIPNACGLDSVITINLSIGASTASVTASVCSSYTAPSGAIYTTTGMYMDTIPNACGADSIITINLTVGANTTASVTATTCTIYTAPSGATYSATGIYTDVIPNACGGDSTITINLTVPVVNISTSIVGATITSAATGSTYQWIDCATNLPIAGATSQAYSSTVDGSYAVIVTTGGCSDTSACATVLFWGLNEVVENGGLEIYPNPSNGDFTVNVLGLSAKTVNIEVLDFSGRVIETRTFNNVQGQLNAIMNVNVEAGSYLVRISANGESTIQTIVISK
jgi:hypothetical protein